MKIKVLLLSATLLMVSMFAVGSSKQAVFIDPDPWTAPTKIAGFIDPDPWTITKV